MNLPTIYTEAWITKMEKPKPVKGKELIRIEVTEINGESEVVQSGGLGTSFEEILQKSNSFCEALSRLKRYKCFR